MTPALRFAAAATTIAPFLKGLDSGWRPMPFSLLHQKNLSCMMNRRA